MVESVRFRTGHWVSMPANHLIGRRRSSSSTGTIASSSAMLVVTTAPANSLISHPAEAELILDAGLALSVVQHPLARNWKPTLALGRQFGAAAADLAGGAGLPAGVTVWLDLEGVAAGSPPQNVIDYCNAWHAEVTAVGYVSGVYVGASPGLTADQLYWDLHTSHYWRGGSSEAAGVPTTLPHRGYQMTQRITGTGSTSFDSDVVRTDDFGGTAQWVSLNTSSLIS